jgi:hypothetical protein
MQIFDGINSVEVLTYKRASNKHKPCDTLVGWQLLHWLLMNPNSGILHGFDKKSLITGNKTASRMKARIFSILDFCDDHAGKLQNPPELMVPGQKMILEYRAFAQNKKENKAKCKRENEAQQFAMNSVEAGLGMQVDQHDQNHSLSHVPGMSAHMPSKSARISPYNPATNQQPQANTPAIVPGAN